jgi:hypothetical protein
MPIFDLLGGTLNSKSWELQKEISSGIEKKKISNNIAGP